MTTHAPAAAPPKTGRHQRSIKNYLLDAPFQLKYTSYIVSSALIVALILGGFLFKTNADLARQSNEVVTASQKVAEESRKVSDMVKMTIKDDPIYSQNPELLNTVTGANSDEDKKRDDYEKQVQAQSAALLHQQAVMSYSLIGGLSLLVLLMGLMGIFVTHKIAGPIHKMKLLLGDVGAGKLNFRGGLRKGDELVHFFEAFQKMCEQLRARQAQEIATLDTAIAEAKAGGAPEAALAKLVSLRDEMQRAHDA